MHSKEDREDQCRGVLRCSEDTQHFALRRKVARITSRRAGIGAGARGTRHGDDVVARTDTYTLGLDSSEELVNTLTIDKRKHDRLEYDWTFLVEVWPIRSGALGRVHVATIWLC
jgi:hypothetical protein